MATTPAETSTPAGTAVLPGSTPLDDHLVRGETLFVAGAALAFLSEVFCTFRSLMDDNLIGTGLGLAFVFGTVYFVCRLYTGRKDVRTPALGWMSVQCLVAVVGTALILAQSRRGIPWAHRVSVPSEYLGGFKAIAYGVFGYLICRKTPALFFLRHKGGESVEVPTATTSLEEVTPAGVVMTLAAADKDRVSALARTLQTVGFVLLAAGFFEAVASGVHLANLKSGVVHAAAGHHAPMWMQNLATWLHLIEGGVIILLGLSFLTPARSVKNVAERSADQNYLADSIEKLGLLSMTQIILVGLILVLTIGGAVLQARL
jgi:hypothetical protein